MAIITSQTPKGYLTAQPASLGCYGCEVVRVVVAGDGAGDATIVLPATSTIKNIYGAIIGGKACIKAAQTFPVAATTGFVISFTATNNATASEIIDILVYGSGV